MRKIYHHDSSLQLESGETISDIEIAYDTFGTMAPDGSNVIWVMHALTANSDVADWWPGTVEAGRFLDPERYFIVCANVLGSCYGTTGPTSINPADGREYRSRFPRVTVRDMVECHKLLARHLGIKRLFAVVGSSLGGFQALEWAVSGPDMAERAVLIATDYRCRPWFAAFNKTMCMAIEADSTYGSDAADAGHRGLAAARAIALMSYRGQVAYDKTQDDREPVSDSPFQRRVHSYQTHQGDKLCRRFDTYSYVRLCEAADSHDIGRGRGGAAEALSRVKARCLVVGIDSDLLFPPSSLREMAQMLPDATYKEISSDFAHDGFLVEGDKLNELVLEFYERGERRTDFKTDI